MLIWKIYEKYSEAGPISISIALRQTVVTPVHSGPQ